MKKGKYVLSAAAFIVTAASVLAYKANTKLSNQRHVYGRTINGCCITSTCFTSNQSFTPSSPACHTLGGRAILLTGGQGKMWTARTVLRGCCTKPTFDWTHTN